MSCPVVEAIHNIRSKIAGFDGDDGYLSDLDHYQSDNLGPAAFDGDMVAMREAEARQKSGAGDSDTADDSDDGIDAVSLGSRIVHDKCTYEITIHVMDVARFRLAKPTNEEARKRYRKIYGDLAGQSALDLVLDNAPTAEVCDALAVVNDAMDVYEEACVAAALKRESQVLPTAVIPALDHRLAKDVYRLDAVVQKLIHYTRAACGLDKRWPGGYKLALDPCSLDVFECIDVLSTLTYPDAPTEEALSVLSNTADRETEVLPHVQLLERYYSAVIGLLGEVARVLASAALHA